MQVYDINAKMSEGTFCRFEVHRKNVSQPESDVISTCFTREKGASIPFTESRINNK